jgi:hypothetical protein
MKFRIMPQSLSESNRVGVVLASLPKEPLEVVYGHPCRAPTATRRGRDAHHAKAACFPAVILTTASYGRNP